MKWTRPMWTILAVAAAMTVGSVGAQETALSFEDAGDFAGKWDLTINSPRGESQGTLEIKEDEGKTVALLKTRPQSDAREIRKISKTADGLKLSYALSFQGQDFEMAMEIKRDGEGLTGVINESNGLFSMEVAGVRNGAAQPAEAAEEGEGEEAAAAARRAAARRRRGPASSTIKIGDDKEIKALWGNAPSDGPDYEAFGSIQDGQVVGFTRTFATKIRTDVNLRIGEAELVAGNHAKDYPGVYSIWLKKKGSSWVLVVNSEPDVWGTMHNDEADLAEVPLKSAKLDEAVERFTVEIKAENGTGTIRIVWGDNEWTAPLTIEG